MTAVTSTTKLTREEYLKRYLNSDSGSKKKTKIKHKKKKVPATKICGLQIIDVDIGMKDIKPLSQDNVEKDDDDEPPLVAEVIDERPKSVQIKEQYSSTHWKRLAHESDDDHQEPDATSLGKNRSRKRYDSDSDCSPPRQPLDSTQSGSPPKDISIQQRSPKHSSRFNTNEDSDTDLCPVRPQKSNNKLSRSSRSHTTKRHHSDSDLSPERIQTRHKSSGSDSDFTPPRYESSAGDINRSQDKHYNYKERKGPSRFSMESETSNESTKFKKASCIDERRELSTSQRTENNEKSKRDGVIEVERINVRKEKNKEEEEKKAKEKQRLEEMQAKYSEWGKGLVQKEQQQNQFKTDLYEMNKPLARYKDDDDLNRILWEQEREEDPMLEYMRKRKKQNSGTDPEKGIPKYSGPPPPPNRFGIPPGYRWDGVDRSNGFEKKYFASLNNAESRATESYLWSIQDM